MASVRASAAAVRMDRAATTNAMSRVAIVLHKGRAAKVVLRVAAKVAATSSAAAMANRVRPASRVNHGRRVIHSRNSSAGTGSNNSALRVLKAPLNRKLKPMELRASLANSKHRAPKVKAAAKAAAAAVVVDVADVIAQSVMQRRPLPKGHHSNKWPRRAMTAQRSPLKPWSLTLR